MNNNGEEECMVTEGDRKRDEGDGILANEATVDERYEDEESPPSSSTVPMMEETPSGTSAAEVSTYHVWRHRLRNAANIAWTPITAMTASYRRFRHRWRHALFFQDKMFRLVVVIGVFVIAFGWTILILFFVQSSRQRKYVPPNPSDQGRPPRPTSYPSAPNGVAPSAVPTYASAQPSRSPITAPPAVVQNAVDWLFPYSNESVWSEPTSPQFQAATWLGFQDENWQTHFPPNDPVKMRGRYALAVLHFACGGDLISSADECDWGDDQWKIQCTETNKHVERISFDNMGLACKLPEELGLLDELRQLRMPSNNLHGSFEFVSRLEKLNWLDLRNNSYSGPLATDWWANMRPLWILDLSHNNFSGVLPSTMAGLPTLKHLRLANNSFSGPVDILSTFPSISDIQLDHNQFSGPLVDETFLADNLLRISQLSLNDNQLTGTIPRNVLESTRLLGFNLANNLFTGSIPDASNLPRIRKIDFSNNDLSGTLPESFGRNFFELVHLDLSRNKLEGVVPWGVDGNVDNSSFRRIQTLYLDENLLTGSIPSFLLTSLPSLEAFSVSGNLLDGTLPQRMTDSLELLNLGACRNITGTIPEELPPKLEYLLLNCNKGLTGTVPSSLSTLLNLKLLRLDGTSVQGKVDEAVCELVMGDAEETTAIAPLPTNYLVARDPVDCICCSECYEQATCDSCRLKGKIRLGNEEFY